MNAANPGRNVPQPRRVRIGYREIDYARPRAGSRRGHSQRRTGRNFRMARCRAFDDDLRNQARILPPVSTFSAGRLRRELWLNLICESVSSLEERTE